ncbi:MAG: hypothetical protein H6658_14305 [Ardenticatenaceae bacterium]|nr:hypothetical protein [Ardenticatenaceae bacterium]
MSRSEAATSVVSPALWAAQQRLLELRKERQGEKSVARVDDGRSTEGNSEKLREIGGNFGELVGNLPEHLGWESVRVTAVCRPKSSHNDESADSSWWRNLVVERVETAVVPPHQQSNPPAPAAQATLTLHPSLALAMLRLGQVAAGRLWLLLRYVDEWGRGWVDVEQARAMFCDKQSALRICGWRQLRKLMAAGEGIFWQRERNRLWLRSVGKVGAALQIGRLEGKPIALPVSILTATMGTVRAHFYASFHSGRDGKRGEGPRSPIARQTLQKLGGICPHTQREYEKRAQVKKQRNFAIGPKAASAQAENVAWQQGSACFELTDYQGQLGKPGMSYLAWQLPNSYDGPHRQQSCGLQKRLNQELADLQEKGTAGNGRKVAAKRYYGEGQLAAKAFNRGETGIFWRGRAGQWFWLGESETGD